MTCRPAGPHGLRNKLPSLNQAENTVRILALIDYFEPGYKAGGPIRTLSNMVARLGDEYAFRIVTRDRDLGSSEAYRGIVANTWSRRGKAEVFYASPGKHLSAIAQSLRQDACDVVYLNSFFSWRSTILPLLLLRIGLARNLPVVLAPRGEFSPGALELRKTKKRLYITMARMLRLCSGVTWQASSNLEVEDIRRIMNPSSSKIFVAPNLLPAPNITSEQRETLAHALQPGPLRLVFLARISPMKNLDFLLRALLKVETELELDIYGPTEDPAYWETCSRFIAELPGNIRASYKGAISADKVAGVFEQYDLFAFPTRGENFGHVIFESLNAGTPVLLSDQTPWQADEDGAIEVLGIGDESAWAEAIVRWCNSDRRTLGLRRRAAHAYAQKMLASDRALLLNKQLFEAAKSSAAEK
jgi:glycosyltransferase involved in cell wall biosynthesis